MTFTYHSNLPENSCTLGHKSDSYFKVMENITSVFLLFSTLQHYRGMVYNGDTDMACNFLGDQEFVESLGLKVNYTI